MRLVAAILLLVAGVALADQLTVLVRYEVATTIDDEAGATNTTHRYILSAPQTLGQLQDAVEFQQATQPAAAVVSNAVVARVVTMLGWVKSKETTVTVVMP